MAPPLMFRVPRDPTDSNRLMRKGLDGVAKRDTDTDRLGRIQPSTGRRAAIAGRAVLARRAFRVVRAGREVRPIAGALTVSAEADIGEADALVAGAAAAAGNLTEAGAAVDIGAGGAGRNAGAAEAGTAGAGDVRDAACAVRERPWRVVTGAAEVGEVADLARRPTADAQAAPSGGAIQVVVAVAERRHRPRDFVADVVRVAVLVRTAAADATAAGVRGGRVAVGALDAALERAARASREAASAALADLASWADVVAGTAVVGIAGQIAADEVVTRAEIVAAGERAFAVGIVSDIAGLANPVQLGAEAADAGA